MRTFIGVIDFYVPAKKEQEAKEEIQEICKYLRNKYDNQAQMIEMHEKVNVIETKTIYKK